MRKMYSYSIWLMPAGKINQRLSKIILKLSGKYKSPKFKPHVTLAGGFTGKKKDLLSKTEKLSKLIKPFTVKLTETSHLSEFYRSLFIHAEKTPELMRAAVIARKLFSLPNDRKYIPHLSLIYGNFSREMKENIIKILGKKFNINFKVKSVYLGFNDERKKQWTIIRKFPLEN